MSVRNRMVHRASVERLNVNGLDSFDQTATEQDVYGGDPLGLTWDQLILTWDGLELDWGAAADTLLPCYVQPQVQRIITNEGRFFAMRTFLMWAPKNATLEEEDRVLGVTDRRGRVLWLGPFRVKAPLMRETHLECTLETYGT